MARVTIGKLQEAIQLCANGGGLCDAAMPPNESARILGAGLHNGLNRGLCPDLFHPIHHGALVGGRKVRITLGHRDGFMTKNVS